MSKNDDLIQAFEERFSKKYENTAGGGAFMTGLGLGAVLGGAAVFFTKTKKGRIAWKKLKKEWDKSKSKMAKEGVLENAEHSLEDWLKHMAKSLSAGIKKTKVVKIAGKTDSVKKAIKKTAKKVTGKPVKKTKRIRKKKQVFKGV